MQPPAKSCHSQSKLRDGRFWSWRRVKGEGGRGCGLVGFGCLRGFLLGVRWVGVRGSECLSEEQSTPEPQASQRGAWGVGDNKGEQATRRGQRPRPGDH